MKKETIITHENIMRRKDVEGFSIDDPQTKYVKVKICLYPKYQIMEITPITEQDILNCDKPCKPMSTPVNTCQHLSTPVNTKQDNEHPELKTVECNFKKVEPIGEDVFNEDFEKTIMNGESDE
jgi:hypothetical protein